MNTLVDLQHWLYGGMWREMKATTDLTSLPAFMAAAFVFGTAHALMPGHGKTVLVSYHLGRASRVVEGVTTGALLALTHVGSAVVFVLAGVAVISRSLASAGRAPAFEMTSAVLITLIGLYLVARTVWPADHAHGRDGHTLAIATGLIPCPLTTFILTYALAHGKLAIGMAAVVTMLLGVITSIVSFAVAAVVARDRFVTLLNRSEAIREKVGFGLELAGGLAVVALGISMISSAVKLI